MLCNPAGIEEEGMKRDVLVMTCYDPCISRTLIVAGRLATYIYLLQSFVSRPYIHKVSGYISGKTLIPFEN